VPLFPHESFAAAMRINFLFLFSCIFLISFSIFPLDSRRHVFPTLPVRVSVALFMSCRRRFGSSVYGPLDVGNGVGISAALTMKFQAFYEPSLVLCLLNFISISCCCCGSHASWGSLCL